MSENEVTKLGVDLPTELYKAFKKKCIDENTTMVAKVKEWIGGWVGAG